MSIELQSISCKGVKSLSLFQKPTLYVAACLVSPSDKTKRQLQRTPMDRDGGRNAEWSQLMRFDLRGDAALSLMLQFELVTHGGILGDKVVGRVRVPVSRLAVPTPTYSHVSYQSSAPDGRPNGVLRFAYKTVDPASEFPLSHHPPQRPAGVFYSPPGMDPSSLQPPATSWAYPPLPDTGPVYVPSSTWTSDLFYNPPKWSSIYPPCPPPPSSSVAAYPPLAPYEAFEKPNSFYYPAQAPVPAPASAAYIYYDPPPTAPSAPAYAYGYGYNY